VSSEDPSFRVVDFSTHLSGPLATHLLTELGADVVKVEHHRVGDGNRWEGELIEGVGVFHLALNSGARSLAVNSHSPDWPKVIEAAAKWADVVVVGTRPADAKRRGMDFETMKEANPRLIYVAVSGFGDRGPWRDYTAHGQTIDTFAGLVPIEDGEVQPRTRSGFRSTGTLAGALFAALGALGGLHRRDSGCEKAQYVSVSLWQSAMWWSWRDLTTLANVGHRWLEYGDLGSRYSLYWTKDDRVMLLAPAERHFWLRFCDVLELPESYRDFGDWSGGLCHGNGPDFDHERVKIAEIMKTRTLDEWVEALEAIEIPFAPLLTLDEAMESEHAAVNGLMRGTSVDGKDLRVTASPIRFADDDQPEGELGPLSPPPALGEHSEEVLAEFGLAPEVTADSVRREPARD
jgi:crotonobetainyl-CoA:carnitine CoA-transferase CaiB-like acyl-CoA transferase